VNTGISLAKLGLRTALMGKAGQDGFGDFVVKVLRTAGLNTEGVVRDPVNNTSATMVMVDKDGERTFIHYIGANGAVRESDINFDLVRKARILHIAGHNLMPGFDGPVAARVLQRAQAEGVMTALDTAWDSSGRWLKLIEPCLPYIEVFVPSIEEARQIAGQQEPSDVADFFLKYGIKIVALKMGKQGCYVKTAQEAFSVPIYDAPVVDATGAGDAFAAGFLAGIAMGWDLKRTAQLGNAVGGLCVGAVGATAGVKSLAETIAFMKKFE
jgi:sugar/nucleoside kinase (ribokinase family)